MRMSSEGKIIDMNMSSPASVSSSSSCGSIRIKIKRSRSKKSIINRRSQRRRMVKIFIVILLSFLFLFQTVQPSMRSSSLPTTILHEKTPVDESISSTNSNEQLDRCDSPIPIDKLVFTTASTTNSKSSYWTVTDRESEWYKLSIPTHSSIQNPTYETVPYKRVAKVLERKKANAHKNERIDRPTYVQISGEILNLFISSRDTTQLIMKAVMQNLDYDMDDGDWKFLQEVNEYNRSKSKKK